MVVSAVLWLESDYEREIERWFSEKDSVQKSTSSYRSRRWFSVDQKFMSSCACDRLN